MKKKYIVGTFVLLLALVIAHLYLNKKESQSNFQNSPETMLLDEEKKKELGEVDIEDPGDMKASTEKAHVYKPSVEIIKKRRLPRALQPHYDKLKALADSGNVDASYILGALLQKCMTFPKTKEELATQLKQAREYAIPVKPIQNGYKLCKDITNEQVGLGLGYLKSAAESGDLEAQIEYLNVIPPELLNYTDEVLNSRPSLREKLDELNSNKIRFAKNAMEKGSLDAVMYLGFSYLDEVSSTGQDKAQALKYILIASRVKPNHTGLNNLSKNLTAELYEYQVEDIQAEVKKFFKERSKDQVFYKLK